MPADDAPDFSSVFADLFTDIPAERPGQSAELTAEELFSGPAAPQGTVVRGGGYAARFDGDTSKLPPEVCWTLQELVAAPHLSEKSSRHWTVLLQYEDVIRSRLSELGLTLEISHEHRHAFTRQADDPNPNSRTILRAKTLSLAASTLALHLYQVYLLSPEEPVVETADLLDHMMAYRPPSDNDEVNFQKRIRAAITSLDEAGLIKPVKGTERYVINSVITAVLTADSIAGLEQRYRAIASGAPLTADVTSPDSEGQSDG